MVTSSLVMKMEMKLMKIVAMELAGVTPGLKKDINGAIIYVPGSSHTYIQ